MNHPKPHPSGWGGVIQQLPTELVFKNCACDKSVFGPGDKVKIEFDWELDQPIPFDDKLHIAYYLWIEKYGRYVFLDKIEKVISKGSKSNHIDHEVTIPYVSIKEGKSNAEIVITGFLEKARLSAWCRITNLTYTLKVILTKTSVPENVNKNQWFEIEIEGHVVSTIDNPCIGILYEEGSSEKIYYRIITLEGNVYENSVEKGFAISVYWKGTRNECFELKVKKFELKIPTEGTHKIILFAGIYNIEEKKIIVTDYREFSINVVTPPTPSPTPTPPPPSKLILENCTCDKTRFKPGDNVLISFDWRLDKETIVNDKLHVAYYLWVEGYEKYVFLDKIEKNIEKGSKSNHVDHKVTIPDLPIKPNEYNAEIIISAMLEKHNLSNSCKIKDLKYVKPSPTPSPTPTITPTPTPTVSPPLEKPSLKVRKGKIMVKLLY